MSRKTKIVIFFVVILIIAIMVIVNLKKGRGGEIAVQTDKVKRGDITQTVSGSGKVQPEVEVKISANVAAEIIKLHVKEGDPVKKGQLLVELDKARYEAAVDRARSNLKSAEANLKKAQSDYKRVQDLFEKNLSSLADLENAEASLQLAESNVAQAKASLTQAEDDLSKTIIRSPIDGIVTKLNKEEGEIALGSQFQADVIMTVADLSRMEVVTEIDENDVVLISLGDEAKIEVDAVPDTSFKGIVSEIAHSATIRGRGTQEEVTNFEVSVAIKENVEKLRPGMSATVDISTETHKDVLHVPIQCVTVRMPDEFKKAEASETSKKSKKQKTAKQEKESSDRSATDSTKSEESKKSKEE
ncbi:MAG: efflux RND transporter periplasmic adaptor subunit, partial [candidate division KSB1 bacterium]|nr:efflux RND transporter periplasmic adaptor subunit [candidate division KSB1 bacterium]